MRALCKCGKEFAVAQWQVASGRGKYCSQACKYKYRVRPKGLVYHLVNENPTSFKKGIVPWNTGTVGVMKANSGSIKAGERRSVVTEFKKGHIPSNFAGDAVGYDALHGWVRRRLGKAKKCQHCDLEQDRIEWANKSHEYKRDLSDWIALCRKCHVRYDIASGAWGKATKRFNLSRT